MNLRNFQFGVDRGCIYTARCNLFHKSTYTGMMVDPSYLSREVTVDNEGKACIMEYRVIPIDAFKEEIFYINPGETGTLLSVIYLNNTLHGFKIRWKQAIDIYYNNPVSIQIASEIKTRLSIDKSVRLEDLFTITKKAPKKKSS